MARLSWKSTEQSLAIPPCTIQEVERYAAEPNNFLFWGENASILQHLLKKYRSCISLIYLDPPFCSDASYHQKTKVGKSSVKSIAYNDFWKEDDYLQFIYNRLILLSPLLKEDGSIFIHCDTHQSHHIRCLLDEVFSPKQFRNEIIWHYTGGGRAKRYFSQKHDTIFWYSKSDNWTFNLDEIRVPYKKTSGYAKNGIRSASGKVYKPHPKGTPVDDTWNIPIINPMSKERIVKTLQELKSEYFKNFLEHL